MISMEEDHAESFMPAGNELVLEHYKIFIEKERFLQIGIKNL